MYSDLRKNLYPLRDLCRNIHAKWMLHMYIYSLLSTKQSRVQV